MERVYKEYRIDYKLNDDSDWYVYDLYSDRVKAVEALQRLIDGGLISITRVLVREVTEWEDVSI